MEDCGNDGHGAEYAQGDPRLDDLAHEQVNPARKQREGRNLTRGASDVQEEGVQHVHVGHRKGAFLAGDAEEGRAGDRIHVLDEALRDGPVGHYGREGDKQEHAGRDGRVEDVLAKAAEGHLGYAYGHHRTDDDHPPGRGGRKVHREQQAGDHRGEVPYGARLLEEPLGDRPFEEHAGRDAHREDEEFGPAIEQDRDYHRRHERDHHVPHQRHRGCAGMDVRIGRNYKIAHIY